MIQFLPFLLGILTGVCSARNSTQPPLVSPTVWNFDDSDSRLAASRGTAVLDYFDPERSSWAASALRFGKASALGLPLMDGSDPEVMTFPVLGKGQGFSVAHHSRANGSRVALGVVSNYTLILDLLWPESESPYFSSILQTDPANSGEADIFYRRSSPGAIGIGGRYSGSISPGRWHRVALTVSAAVGAGGVGLIQKFIDGRLVGAQNTDGSSRISRWSLREEFLLFADGKGSAGPGAVASLLFVPRVMTHEEIEALGGPTAKGADVPGAPVVPTVPLTTRRVAIIAHRGDSCCAPENTVIAIRQAFAKGADHIEVDVQKTLDGVAILMHDNDVDRTTNGEGTAWDLFARLRRLDAGGWFDRRFYGEPIPTLTEALVAAKGRGRLLLDIRDEDLAAGIRLSLKKAGVGTDAIWAVHNVNVEAIRSYRKEIPGVEILWNGLPDRLDKKSFDRLKELGVVGLELEFSKVTPEVVKAAHANGLYLFVYTLLDAEQMLTMIDMGVDGIETDVPALLDSLMIVGGTPELLPAR